MTAQGFSRSEFLVAGIVFVAIVVALLAVARLWPARSLRRPASSDEPVAEMPVPVATPSTDAPERIPDAVMPSWPLLIDADAGALDADSRKRVLAGLGIVGDRWCIDVLAQAFEQETGASRVAAIEAIGSCDDALVAPMLALAYASPVLEERYAAVDGASRRGDLPLLECGLRDADAGVALAAAYGLQRSRRPDLVAAGLAERGAEEAAEIRRLLVVLG